jgi:hypothetical protein
MILRSPVVLVTRDINLQNEAEFANVPFMETPTPNRRPKIFLSAADCFGGPF